MAGQKITKKQAAKLKSFFIDINVEGNAKELAKYAQEDQRFHEYLMEIAGGEVFSSVFKAYAIVIFTYHADLEGGFVRHPKETIQEHLDLIDAVCDHDEKRAEQLMRDHMSQGREKFKNEIKKEEEEQTTR